MRGRLIMLKKIFLIILLAFSVVFFAIYSAQTQELEWAKQDASGLSIAGGDDIAVDGLGNSYVTGRFQVSATFGAGESNETTLTSAGGWDIFVAKYDSNGELLWVKQIVSSGNDENGENIAIDSSGNCYVTGFFQGEATFGEEPNEIKLTSSGSFDIFFAKYNSSGGLEWVKKAGGSGSDQGYAVVIDGLNNSYVTGIFSGTVNFDEYPNVTELTSAGGWDIFVAKYDSSGRLEWAKKAGSQGNDQGINIDVDASGTSYVTGRFRGSAIFGDEPNQTILSSAGGYDIFVAKYDSSGGLEWAKKAGSPDDHEQGISIAIDALGASYVTGQFQGEATFGKEEPNETKLTTSGGFDIFVAKYDGDGKLEWAKKAGGTAGDGGYGIDVDFSGASYVTGNFEGSATFGAGETNETTLSSSGFRDIFVARYSSDGELLWIKQAGGSADDGAGSIVIDGSGNSYVTGGFSSSYPDGAIFGAGETNETTLYSSGSWDMFIAKFSNANICEVKNDYDDSAGCVNTFKAYTIDDLSQYVATDYGRDGGTNYKHLKIMADLSGDALDIESPCEITLKDGVKLSGNFVSLDGRKGVLDNNGYVINANKACVLSEQDNAGLGAGSVVNVGELIVQATKTAKIGLNSTVNVEGQLKVISTGDYSSSTAIIKAGSEVVAGSLEMESLRNAHLGENTTVASHIILAKYLRLNCTPN
jgi:hypothetical protein